MLIAECFGLELSQERRRYDDQTRSSLDLPPVSFIALLTASRRKHRP